MNIVPQRPRMGATHLLRTLFAGLLATAVLASALPATLAQAEDEVSIPDAALKSCISAALTDAGLPGDFTATNLAKLSSIYCYANRDGDIADLAGISHLSGATRISLLNATATDLAPLSTLTAVDFLYLVDYELVDPSPLAAMTGLTDLYLYAPQVTSYAFTTDLSKLARADFRTSADDLSLLAGLPDLAKLSVRTSSATALAAMSSLTNLTHLTIESSAVGGLAGLTLPTGQALSNLWVRGSNLEDLADLPASSSVTTLRVTSSSLTSLDGIEALEHLRKLSTQTPQLKDLSAVAELPDLLTLDASSSQITDISAVAGLKKLYELVLDQNHISDLKPLADLATLETLNLAGNHISDLDPLADLATLRTLNLAGNHISDLDPLDGIPLSWLSASSNQISEVGALTHLAAQAEVFLSQNRIHDFSPIPDDASVSLDGQELPAFAQAKVGHGFDLGLRSVTGQPICPKFSPAAACTNGLVTYPLSGTYEATYGSVFSFTQYAGPNRKFATPPLKFQNPVAVGTALVADGFSWKPAPERWISKWYRDGKLISTESELSSYYTATADDLGHRLKLCVTGYRDGVDPATACTGYSTKVMRGTFSVPDPTIRGTKKVGHQLVGSFAKPVPGANLKYRWLRDDKTIKGATATSYRLTKADRGHRISWRVTVSARAYETGVFYSKRYRVR